MKKIDPKSAKEDKQKVKNEIVSKRDVESTNSTIEKMEDFIDEHGVSSNLSTTDSINPMESSSFPLDYEELQAKIKMQQKQEMIKPKLTPIKKVLESKRNDFEEIRLHLERRSQEMKKRIMKMGDFGRQDDKKDDKKENTMAISYYSTEFTPDIEGNTAYKTADSLSNKERLQILSDKCKKESAKKKEKKKAPERSEDVCGPTTHAIFAHLAKLKSIKNIKSKVSKVDVKVKVAPPVPRVDSDPSLSLHDNTVGSITSQTSIKSNAFFRSLEED